VSEEKVGAEWNAENGDVYKKKRKGISFDYNYKTSINNRGQRSEAT
jgi:hypothetical protein